MGRDTHALSEPAFHSAVEVLAANDVEIVVDRADGYTPTPVISHAILTWNRGHSDHMADGIVVTPSHNPPEDGGFKYNPPNGGPADTDVTDWIQNEANELLAAGPDHLAARQNATLLKFQGYRADSVHQTHDPEVIVAELELHGTVIGTGRPVRLRSIAVIRVQGGQIVSYRDYYNPIAPAEATGRLPELFSMLSSQQPT